MGRCGGGLAGPAHLSIAWQHQLLSRRKKDHFSYMRQSGKGDMAAWTPIYGRFHRHRTGHAHSLDNTRILAIEWS